MCILCRNAFIAGTYLVSPELDDLNFVPNRAPHNISATCHLSTSTLPAFKSPLQVYILWACKHGTAHHVCRDGVHGWGPVSEPPCSSGQRAVQRQREMTKNEREDDAKGEKERVSSAIQKQGRAGQPRPHPRGLACMHPQPPPPPKDSHLPSAVFGVGKARSSVFPRFELTPPALPPPTCPPPPPPHPRAAWSSAHLPRARPAELSRARPSPARAALPPPRGQPSQPPSLLPAHVQPVTSRETIKAGAPLEPAQSLDELSYALFASLAPRSSSSPLSLTCKCSAQCIIMSVMDTMCYNDNISNCYRSFQASAAKRQRRSALDRKIHKLKKVRVDTWCDSALLLGSDAPCSLAFSLNLLLTCLLFCSV